VGNLESFKDFLEGIDMYERDSLEIGVAINPSTLQEDLFPLVPCIDFIQCMGNDNIGYQGISLDEDVYEKIKILREKYSDIPIAVDIGVNETTAPLLIKAGATKLLIGSAIFESDDIIGKIEEFKIYNMFLSDIKVKELEGKANDIRISIIEMLLEAKSGHTAGPLGMADIFAIFYFHILKHDPKNPFWEERDRVILSNGHICPVLYAAMAHSGYFLVEELLTLRKFGTRLQGHPHREYLPMLENSSGPLGEGLAQATGMALADKIDGKDRDRFIYCFMSDGEHDEGGTWEAIMLAGKNKLRNLIAIVDRNNIQIDGFTEDIMPLDPIADKWRAFNWHVIEISGHDMREINQAVEEAQAIYEKPTVIIAHTIPGKGVREFERDYKWHGKAPNKEEAEMALKELRR